MTGDAGRPADSPRFADSTSPPFTGVVLAGGHSRRFGETNKAVAVVDGDTYVQRAVRTVRAVADDSPLVAVKDDDQRATVEAGLESAADARFAFDATSFGGPLSGLYGSLSAVHTEWLFLTGCDMPRLRPAAIAWLANRLRTTRSPPDALVPVHPDGGREPLHAFYRRDAVADARSRLRPDDGLQTLLDALSAPTTVPIPAAPSDVSLATSVENVNTKREHRRVRHTVER
ncbi:molybdenum cofactor guanylyltransferase [Halorussus salinisoli]|uniref:molybdenum cofactor guanylyltransferase n=1 Tax=Halorussus salinisoli TaxID=2558242 RepID=UPI0010C1B94B|nr:molybdenum cofactor guanylyltransferase [Halorussus salinisoli]